MRLYDYAASANCYKVRLLLALLGASYERVPVDIFAGQTLEPSFRALNPACEVPVLELDSGEVLTQSNAILWFLAEGTPLRPATPVGRAQALAWTYLEQERVMMGVGGARFRRLTGREARDPALVAARVELGRSGLELLDAHLRSRRFVVEERPTYADVALYGYAHVAADAGLDPAHYPGVEAWLARVAALPGFVDDLEPYPPNARPGAGRSLYD